MNESVAPLVVIGVGNVLRRDDGIGVRVVEDLRQLARHDPELLPRGTRLVDAGALLMDLAHTVRDARGLVLVDAQRTGAPEGSVSIERGDAIAADGPDSGHAPGSPGELLAVARLMGWLPEQVALVGVEVGGLGVGTELTPVAAAALPGAVEMVCRELHLMDQRTAGLPVRDGAGALTGAAS